MIFKEEPKKAKGVYAITCIPSAKIYVGCSSDIKGRLKTHLSDLRSGRHVNNHLQASWVKYGSNSFQFEVLEYTDDYFEAEKKWIKELHSYEKGFNQSRGGDGLTPEICSLGAKIVGTFWGPHNAKHGIGICSKDFDHSAAGKIAGTNAVKNGTGIHSDITKYSRLGGSIAGNICKDKRLGICGLNDKERKEAATLGGKIAGKMPWWYNESTGHCTRRIESPGEGYVKGRKPWRK